MSILYDRLAATAEGARRLAKARLRHEALRALHRALDSSGLSQNELAARLRIRKSAVSQTLRGDGNLRVNTLADYMHAMGFELALQVVQAGEPRKAMVEGREARPAFPPQPTRHDTESNVTGDRPLALGGEESIHVVDMGSRHMLLEMNVQPTSAGGDSFRFDGEVHLVDKTTQRDTFVTPDEFKPLRTGTAQ